MLNKTTLYGDGIHDDAPAIQAMLDNGQKVVELPVPKEKYMIGSTLQIGSNQTLKLDLNTTIQLMANRNCLMLQNKNRYTQDENIAVIGGIWDMNNIEQAPNPLVTKKDWKMTDFVHKNGEYTDAYSGVAIRFSHVKNLMIRDAVLKNPVTFAIQMANIEYFTIENITFDFNLGNPGPLNMDGIHIDGICRFGVIRNLKGTCYDDLIALNADDFGACGAIEDIEIDGIFAVDCHSAVRLLSTESPVRRISISNIFGTYYQYCIGLTYYYYERCTIGVFDQISIKNIFVSKALRPGYLLKDDQDIYAPVWIDKRLNIKYVTIDNCHRREENIAKELIRVEAGTEIKNLALSNVSQENETGMSCPLIVNYGVISKLYLNNVDADKDELIINKGRIEKLVNAC